MNNDLPPHDQEETGFDQPPDPDAKKERKKPRKPNWLEKTNTTILFLALGAASAAAYFADKGADATRDQAEAAWKQIAEAKKTTQQELRAYLSVELARMIPIGENRITHIPLKIVNSGQTPAFNLTFDSLSYQETPENFENQDVTFASRDRRPLGIGFIPRQTSRTRLFATNHPINPEAMRKGTHRLYSTGKIFYDDAWGDEHWITFCIWWGSNGFAAKHATYCNRHNDTDRPEKVLP